MRRIRNVFLFASVLIISFSLSSGLELSASIGCNDGSSSTNVAYGSAVDDYASEHVCLNTMDGGLSNTFSGSGSLPSGSISVSDSSGNKASVTRSIDGIRGYTTWSYDWRTSRTAGAFASLSMNCKNAILIRGGATASNLEGDKANTNIYSCSPEATASLSDYSASATSTRTYAEAHQEASSMSGENFWFDKSASNREGENAHGSVWVQGGGSSNGYSGTAKSMKTEVDSFQSINSAKGGYSIALDERAYSIINGVSSTEALEFIIINNGKIDAYSSHATAMKDGTGMYRATSSQNIYYASGNNIQIDGSALKGNEVRENGPIHHLYDVSASERLEIDGGYIFGYSGNAMSTKKSSTATAIASQTVNYAPAKSIQIDIRSSQKNGETADISSSVKNGYIFLYSDQSQAYNTPASSTTASADMKAYGKIDVQSSAKNQKTSTCYLPSSFKTSGKLVATIDTTASSNSVKINSKTWKGLAFMAIQSNALAVGKINPGHAGVGIWNNDGTWSIGSLQGGIQKWNFVNLFGASVLPGQNNFGWCAHNLNWLDVQKLLSGTAIDKKNVQTRDGFKNYRPGDAYDAISIIKVSNPNPDEANKVMDEFKNRGFWFGGMKYGIFAITLPTQLALDVIYSGNKYWSRFSNDCLDATVDVLKAYGVPKETASSPLPYTFPNYYFGKLNGKVYKWSQTKKMYE